MKLSERQLKRSNNAQSALGVQRPVELKTDHFDGSTLMKRIAVPLKREGCTQLQSVNSDLCAVVTLLGTSISGIGRSLGELDGIN